MTSNKNFHNRLTFELFIKKNMSKKAILAYQMHLLENGKRKLNAKRPKWKKLIPIPRKKSVPSENVDVQARAYILRKILLNCIVLSALNSSFSSSLQF